MYMSSNAKPELDHRKGHLGLQADDHGVRAAQPGHVRDRAQRPGRERVHHVDRGDVDDDALRADTRLTRSIRS